MLILQFLPLYLIVFSANLETASRVWRWMALGAMLFVTTMLFFVGATLALAGPALMGSLVQEGVLSTEALDVSVQGAGGLVLATAIVSMGLLLPAVRGALIRGLRLAMEVDEHRPHHRAPLRHVVGGADAGAGALVHPIAPGSV